MTGRTLAESAKAAAVRPALRLLREPPEESIPKLIDELAPGYEFHLRFRSSPIYPTEITLLAV